MSLDSIYSIQDFIVSSRAKEPGKFNRKLYRSLVAAGLVGPKNAEKFKLKGVELRKASQILFRASSRQTYHADIVAQIGLANTLSAQMSVATKNINESRKKLAAILNKDPDDLLHCINAHNDYSIELSNYVSPFEESHKQLIEDYEFLLAEEIITRTGRDRLGNLPICDVLDLPENFSYYRDGEIEPPSALSSMNASAAGAMLPLIEDEDEAEEEAEEDGGVNDWNSDVSEASEDSDLDPDADEALEEDRGTGNAHSGPALTAPTEPSESSESGSDEANPNASNAEPSVGLGKFSTPKDKANAGSDISDHIFRQPALPTPSPISENPSTGDITNFVHFFDRPVDRRSTIQSFSNMANSTTARNAGSQLGAGLLQYLSNPPVANANATDSNEINNPADANANATDSNEINNDPAGNARPGVDASRSLIIRPDSNPNESSSGPDTSTHQGAALREVPNNAPHDSASVNDSDPSANGSDNSYLGVALTEIPNLPPDANAGVNDLDPSANGLARSPRRSVALMDIPNLPPDPSESSDSNATANSTSLVRVRSMNRGPFNGPLRSSLLGQHVPHAPSSNPIRPLQPLAPICANLMQRLPPQPTVGPDRSLTPPRNPNIPRDVEIPGRALNLLQSTVGIITGLARRAGVPLNFFRSQATAVQPVYVDPSSSEHSIRGPNEDPSEDSGVIIDSAVFPRNPSMISSSPASADLPPNVVVEGIPDDVTSSEIALEETVEETSDAVGLQVPENIERPSTSELNAPSEEAVPNEDFDESVQAGLTEQSIVMVDQVDQVVGQASNRSWNFDVQMRADGDDQIGNRTSNNINLPGNPGSVGRAMARVFERPLGENTEQLLHQQLSLTPSNAAVTTQPVETQPVETQPVETQPVTTQPVTTQPEQESGPSTNHTTRSNTQNSTNSSQRTRRNRKRSRVVSEEEVPEPSFISFMHHSEDANHMMATNQTRRRIVLASMARRREHEKRRQSTGLAHATRTISIRPQSVDTDMSVGWDTNSEADDSEILPSLGYSFDYNSAGADQAVLPSSSPRREDQNGAEQEAEPQASTQNPAARRLLIMYRPRQALPPATTRTTGIPAATSTPLAAHQPAPPATTQNAEVPAATTTPDGANQPAPKRRRNKVVPAATSTPLADVQAVPAASEPNAAGPAVPSTSAHNNPSASRVQYAYAPRLLTPSPRPNNAPPTSAPDNAEEDTNLSFDNNIDEEDAASAASAGASAGASAEASAPTSAPNSTNDSQNSMEDEEPPSHTWLDVEEEVRHALRHRFEAECQLLVPRDVHMDTIEEREENNGEESNTNGFRSVDTSTILPPPPPPVQEEESSQFNIPLNEEYISKAMKSAIYRYNINLTHDIKNRNGETIKNDVIIKALKQLVLSYGREGASMQQFAEDISNRLDIHIMKAAYLISCFGGLLFGLKNPADGSPESTVTSTRYPLEDPESVESIVADNEFFAKNRTIGLVGLDD